MAPVVYAEILCIDFNDWPPWMYQIDRIKTQMSCPYQSLILRIISKSAIDILDILAVNDYAQQVASY